MSYLRSEGSSDAPGGLRTDHPPTCRRPDQQIYRPRIRVPCLPMDELSVSVRWGSAVAVESPPLRSSPCGPPSPRTWLGGGSQCVRDAAPILTTTDTGIRDPTSDHSLALRTTYFPEDLLPGSK
ncbi:hypothetical protein GSI_14759 [Ganoderma sinense ZZ0214-1]|uniref:Uncharacterized protein n=1 Tax=Ganoderma sinense ZZ0214-1 TaxID=1077348 RepID=A0A2G8RQ28_9APHY|nr:hypothetical protein GSI_14759 [Ganoderma sinense ZZ0214-1]